MRDGQIHSAPIILRSLRGSESAATLNERKPTECCFSSIRRFSNSIMNFMLHLTCPYFRIFLIKMLRILNVKLCLTFVQFSGLFLSRCMFAFRKGLICILWGLLILDFSKLYGPSYA